MTTASQTPGHQPTRTAAAPPCDPPLTLADEHALLLSQVVIRAEALLAVTAEDRWPARELQALVGYLRAEVLGQDADEERLLFPAGASPASPGWPTTTPACAPSSRRWSVWPPAAAPGLPPSSPRPPAISSISSSATSTPGRHCWQRRAHPARRQRPPGWAPTRMSGIRSPRDR